MFESKEIVNKITSENYRKGLFLWILHADKIPPHAGLSNNGEYFSLKANGRDSKLSIRSLAEIIERKQIPTIIVELVNIEIRPLASIFFNYKCTIPGEITCLNPIKDTLNITEAGKLHNLLKELKENDKIHKIQSVFLPESFHKLPDYNEMDIHEYLSSLNGVTR